MGIKYNIIASREGFRKIVSSCNDLRVAESILLGFQVLPNTSEKYHIEAELI